MREPIARWFPELRKDADPRKQAITIEDLLTMRSGLESTSGGNYGRWVSSRNWVRYALERPMVSDPGTSMEYSTGTSHLLSAILTKASGKTTHQFAAEVAGKAARHHAGALAARSAGHLLRRQRDADDAAADDRVRASCG